MGSGNKFVYAPADIAAQRSMFDMSFKSQGSYFHGDLVPFYLPIKVFPGDTFAAKIAMVIRMSTPIAPIMSNIYMNAVAFYVPERTVWSKYEQFIGVNKEGVGIPTEIERPSSTNVNNIISYADSTKRTRTICNYFGLGCTGPKPVSGVQPISLNPIRGFYKIYNDWFRTSLDAPYLWDDTQVGVGDRCICTLNGSSVYAGYIGPERSEPAASLPTVPKKLDRFVSCLPFAQRSTSPVTLPLGTSADVYVRNLASGFTFPASTAIDGMITGSTAIAPGGKGELFGFTSDSGVNHNLDFYADLSTATAATINEIRFAFQLQRYLEKTARVMGSNGKYRDWLKGIWNVTPKDKTIQMAQYLGGVNFMINIDQVLNMSDYATGSTSKLGSTGAVSVTGFKGDLFNASFDEQGWLYFLMYTKHDHVYGQGLGEVFTDTKFLDDYKPPFAHIGEQPILKKRLFFDGTDEKAVFGLQTAWSDLYHNKDLCTGELNPAYTTSLDYWTLSDEYASAPSLTASFLKENRDAISRCLVTGATGPDFIYDIKVNLTAVREMPVDTTPGLLDHF